MNRLRPRPDAILRLAQVAVVVASLSYLAWTLRVSESRQDAREIEFATRRAQVIAENKQSIEDRARIARDLDRIAERLERLLPSPSPMPKVPTPSRN